MKNYYAAVAGVVIFSALGILLMLLDFILSTKRASVGGFLFTFGPVLGIIASGLEHGYDDPQTDLASYNRTSWYFVPFIIISFILFILWFLKQAAPEFSDDECLTPMKFRIMHFMDVFKNLRSDHTNIAI